MQERLHSFRGAAACANRHDLPGLHWAAFSAMAFLALVPLHTNAQEEVSIATPPTSPPQAPPGEEGWNCGPSLCCRTEPVWLYDWFMRNLPNGDSCQLQLELWGYVLIAAIAFLVSSTCCMACYFTRSWKCWDPCRPCCLPFCRPTEDPVQDIGTTPTLKYSTTNRITEFNSLAPPTTGWATIVPEKAYKINQPSDLPLVPDYHPANHSDGSHIFDFASWVSSLAPDTANAVSRHHMLAQRSQETLINGRTRHMAYMLGQRLLPDMVEIYEPGSALFQTAPPALNTMGEGGTHTAITVDGGIGTLQQGTMGPNTTKASSVAATAQPSVGATGSVEKVWYNPMTWGRKQAAPATGEAALGAESAKNDNEDEEGAIGTLHQTSKNRSPVKPSQAEDHQGPPPQLGLEAEESDDAAGGRLTYPDPGKQPSPKKRGFFNFGNPKGAAVKTEGDGGEQGLGATASAVPGSGADASPAKKSWFSRGKAASPPGKGEEKPQASASPGQRRWFGLGKAAESAPQPEQGITAPPPVGTIQQPADQIDQHSGEGEESTQETSQALPPSYPPPGYDPPGDEEVGQDGQSSAENAPQARNAGVLGGLFGKRSSPSTNKNAKTGESGSRAKSSPMKGLFGRASPASGEPPQDAEDKDTASGRGMFGFMRGKKPEAGVAGDPESDEAQTEGDLVGGSQQDIQNGDGSTHDDDQDTTGRDQNSQSPSQQEQLMAKEHEPAPHVSERTSFDYPPPLDQQEPDSEPSASAVEETNIPSPKASMVPEDPVPPEADAPSTPIGPPAGGLEPLKPAGGLAPLKPAGGLEPLKPPGGGLKPLAPLKGPQPVLESMDGEIQEIPPQGMGLTGGLAPSASASSNRYSNMEGTIEDMQSAAALTEAARAVSEADETQSSQKDQAPVADSLHVRGSAQSLDTDDGF